MATFWLDLWHERDQDMGVLARRAALEIRIRKI
jgi:hypothetical protein